MVQARVTKMHRQLKRTLSTSCAIEKNNSTARDSGKIARNWTHELTVSLHIMRRMMREAKY